MARIRKGDTVIVLTGKDKGKTGKVLQVWPERDRALVERINVMKHFERRSQQNPQGGIVARESSVAMPKLGVFCPRCKKAANIGWKVEAGDKQRMCRRCNDVLAMASR